MSYKGENTLFIEYPASTPSGDVLRLQLEEQVRMYVQLVTQTYLLTSGNSNFDKINADCKKNLTELKEIAARNRLFHAHNLDSALDIVKDIENGETEKLKNNCKHKIKPAINYHVRKIMLTSEVFIYPELLPTCGLSKTLFEKRPLFNRQEDYLIALGLENFPHSQTNLQQAEKIRDWIMPSKTAHQIACRIKNVKAKMSTTNPLKYYLENGELPQLSRTVKYFDPHNVKAPNDQPDYILPEWARDMPESLRPKKDASLEKNESSSNKNDNTSSSYQLIVPQFQTLYLVPSIQMPVQLKPPLILPKDKMINKNGEKLVDDASCYLSNSSCAAENSFQGDFIVSDRNLCLEENKNVTSSVNSFVDCSNGNKSNVLILHQEISEDLTDGLSKKTVSRSLEYVPGKNEVDTGFFIKTEIVDEIDEPHKELLTVNAERVDIPDFKSVAIKSEIVDEPETEIQDSCAINSVIVGSSDCSSNSLTGIEPMKIENKRNGLNNTPTGLSNYGSMSDHCNLYNQSKFLKNQNSCSSLKAYNESEIEDGSSSSVQNKSVTKRARSTRTFKTIQSYKKPLKARQKTVSAKSRNNSKNVGFICEENGQSRIVPVKSDNRKKIRGKTQNVLNEFNESKDSNPAFGPTLDNKGAQTTSCKTIISGRKRKKFRNTKSKFMTNNSEEILDWNVLKPDNIKNKSEKQKLSPSFIGCTLFVNPINKSFENIKSNSLQEVKEKGNFVKENVTVNSERIEITDNLGGCADNRSKYQKYYKPNKRDRLKNCVIRNLFPKNLVEQESQSEFVSKNSDLVIKVNSGSFVENLNEPNKILRDDARKKRPYKRAKKSEMRKSFCFGDLFSPKPINRRKETKINLDSPVKLLIRDQCNSSLIHNSCEISNGCNIPVKSATLDNFTKIIDNVTCSTSEKFNEYQDVPSSSPENKRENFCEIQHTCEINDSNILIKSDTLDKNATKFRKKQNSYFSPKACDSSDKYDIEVEGPSSEQNNSVCQRTRRSTRTSKITPDYKDYLKASEKTSCVKSRRVSKNFRSICEEDAQSKIVPVKSDCRRMIQEKTQIANGCNESEDSHSAFEPIFDNRDAQTNCKRRKLKSSRNKFVNNGLENFLSYSNVHNPDDIIDKSTMSTKVKEKVNSRVKSKNKKKGQRKTRTALNARNESAVLDPVLHDKDAQTTDCKKVSDGRKRRKLKSTKNKSKRQKLGVESFIECSPFVNPVDNSRENIGGKSLQKKHSKNVNIKVKGKSNKNLVEENVAVNSEKVGIKTDKLIVLLNNITNNRTGNQEDYKKEERNCLQHSVIIMFPTNPVEQINESQDRTVSQHNNVISLVENPTDQNEIPESFTKRKRRYKRSKKSDKRKSICFGDLFSQKSIDRKKETEDNLESTSKSLITYQHNLTLAHNSCEKSNDCNILVNSDLDNLEQITDNVTRLTNERYSENQDVHCRSPEKKNKEFCKIQHTSNIYDRNVLIKSDSLDYLMQNVTNLPNENSIGIPDLQCEYLELKNKDTSDILNVSELSNNYVVPFESETVNNLAQIIVNETCSSNESFNGIPGAQCKSLKNKNEDTYKTENTSKISNNFNVSDTAESLNNFMQNGENLKSLSENSIGISDVQFRSFKQTINSTYEIENASKVSNVPVKSEIIDDFSQIAENGTCLTNKNFGEIHDIHCRSLNNKNENNCIIESTCNMSNDFNVRVKSEPSDNFSRIDKNVTCLINENSNEIPNVHCRSLKNKNKYACQIQNTSKMFNDSNVSDTSETSDDFTKIVENEISLPNEYSIWISDVQCRSLKNKDSWEIKNTSKILKKLFNDCNVPVKSKTLDNFSQLVEVVTNLPSENSTGISDVQCRSFENKNQELLLPNAKITKTVEFVANTNDAGGGIVILSEVVEENEEILDPFFTNQDEKSSDSFCVNNDNCIQTVFSKLKTVTENNFEDISSKNTTTHDDVKVKIESDVNSEHSSCDIMSQPISRTANFNVKQNSLNNENLKGFTNSTQRKKRKYTKRAKNSIF